LPSNDLSFDDTLIVKLSTEINDLKAQEALMVGKNSVITMLNLSTTDIQIQLTGKNKDLKLSPSFVDLTTQEISFNEDQNRLRSGHAAENVAMMNKVALNLLKNEKSVKVGVKNKRLKAGWDNDYMLKVLSVGLLSV